jgi:histidinol-phosphatase (PHP family)
MPFSHHSHSGQFCHHAKNTLEEIVLRAIELHMTTFALTEHIPPDGVEDLYPEEVSSLVLEDIPTNLQQFEAKQTPESLYTNFQAFYIEASRLREKYASKMTILLGFESEWIRSSSDSMVKHLLNEYKFDLFVGSIHHVDGIPIDFDHAMYEKARAASGGTDSDLFIKFFDTQFSMLKRLEPPVVGHFDLIRLKSNNPDTDFTQDNQVWARIDRNLSLIAAYGGVLEINTSGLRKGLADPYPTREICELFNSKNGRFTLSDDSHAIDQVGYGYSKMVPFVTRLQIDQLVVFKRCFNSDRVGSVHSLMSRSELAAQPFFSLAE